VKKKFLLSDIIKPSLAITLVLLSFFSYSNVHKKKNKNKPNHKRTTNKTTDCGKQIGNLAKVSSGKVDYSNILKRRNTENFNQALTRIIKNKKRFVKINILNNQDLDIIKKLLNNDQNISIDLETANRIHRTLSIFYDFENDAILNLEAFTAFPLNLISHLQKIGLTITNINKHYQSIYDFINQYLETSSPIRKQLYNSAIKHGFDGKFASRGFSHDANIIYFNTVKSLKIYLDRNLFVEGTNLDSFITSKWLEQKARNPGFSRETFWEIYKLYRGKNQQTSRKLYFAESKSPIQFQNEKIKPKISKAAIKEALDFIHTIYSFRGKKIASLLGIEAENFNYLSEDFSIQLAEFVSKQSQENYISFLSILKNLSPDHAGYKYLQAKTGLSKRKIHILLKKLTGFIEEEVNVNSHPISESGRKFLDSLNPLKRKIPQGKEQKAYLLLLDKLNPTNTEILLLINSGKTQEEIIQELDITKKHLQQFTFFARKILEAKKI